MNRKKLGVIFVILGCLLAIGVGAVVYLQSTQAAEIARQIPTVQVVVVAADVAERAAVPSSSVILASVPAGMVPVDSATNLEDVVGKYPTTRLYKNEIVVRSKLADTGGGRSAPSYGLNEGKVAVTLAGTDLMTPTGAIRPGDRVDILLTLPLPRTTSSTTGSQSGATQNGQPGVGQPTSAQSQNQSQEKVNLPMVTQTLVQNVEVLRVGAFASAAQVPAEGNNAPTAKGITFQVSHQDALVIKWAKDSGGVVDLALRHPADREPVNTDAITARYVLDKFRFQMAEPLK